MKRFILAVALIVIAAIAAVAFASGLTSEPEHKGLYHWKGGTPVGYTFADLQHYEFNSGSVATINAKLYEAEATGANTIRLQIVQDRLVGIKGNRYDAEYMSYIQQVTDYGLAIGLTMVLNAQTEYAKHFGANEPLPTHATHVFWHKIMAIYANVPHVKFDLFNEPRNCTPEEWRATHQALVTMVRKHAHNTIWLEGMRYASTLEDLPKIHGKHLVYTFHHPGAPWPGQSEHNAKVWDTAFGNHAWQRLPVVDAEFTNDAKTYKMPRSELNNYLRYAKRHHIGMLVYGLHHQGLLERYMKA